MQNRVSNFKNFNEVVADMTIKEIATLIASDKFKSQVKKLRILKQSGNEKQYCGQKKLLPAFTASGLFEGGRKMEFLQEYSKMIILDLDKIKEDRFEEIRHVAEKSAFTHCCFTSPGGDGLKIIVRVNDSKEHHRLNFNAIKKHYERLLGVDIDPSGKDITRLCFFSWDPQVYYNEKSKEFQILKTMSVENDVKKIIEQIDSFRIDITDNYEDWCKIGFALESEFGEHGRSYFHAISRHFPDYNHEICNEQYNKCLKSNNSGITIKTLFHLAKDYGLDIRPEQLSISADDSSVKSKESSKTKQGKKSSKEKKSKVTSNKFVLAEAYLNDRFDIRYNEVSNKFEYKAKGTDDWEDMNDNNMYVKLQKDGITISQNNLLALLKSDFVNKHDPFVEYFEGLPEWDRKTDHIKYLASFVHVDDRERYDHHFKKWLVRTVKTATKLGGFNKQAFVLVSKRQNCGKSYYCRFLVPNKLGNYIAENINTDKDSLVAITENFLINLDELSSKEKADLNAFKSMFSKDKIKARLTYDKRASVHIRRASFIASTDKWEFLTDENGSVRWLCMEIDDIDWSYPKKVDMDKVYAQAWYLANDENFDAEMTREEIDENNIINKKYQISTPEADLVDRFFSPGTKEDFDVFYNATEILEYIMDRTNIKLIPEKVGKALRFLDYERISRKINGKVKQGYWLKRLQDI